MSCKTILVHVDESKRLEARVAYAARIALAEGAFLTGMAASGISRLIPAATPTPYAEDLRQRASRALAHFESEARASGALSYGTRLVEDEAVAAMVSAGRYNDLLVLGQFDPDEPSPILLPGFPESVVMASDSPTLVLPYRGQFQPLPERALIAWNGSEQALRAVRGALPLLRHASQVDIAILNPDAVAELEQGEAGTELASYLAHQGLRSEIIRQEGVRAAEVGPALLALAAARGSTLLVMGCYGHSRFREVLLGGSSLHVLQAMTLPVLMAH